MLKDILAQRDSINWNPDNPQSIPFTNSNIKADEIGTSLGKLLPQPPDHKQSEQNLKVELETTNQLIKSISDIPITKIRDISLLPEVVNSLALKELNHYKILLDTTIGLTFTKNSGLLSSFRIIQSEVMRLVNTRVTNLIKKNVLKPKVKKSDNIFKSVLTEKSIVDISYPPELPLISGNMIQTALDREELVTYLISSYEKLEDEGYFITGPDELIDKALEFALNESISATSELISLILYMQEQSEGRLNTLEEALYIIDDSPLL